MTNTLAATPPGPATPARAARRLTGLKPTGHLHLGNLLGAVRPMLRGQYAQSSVVMLADLHALTVDHDPHRVRALTLEQTTLLLAAGIDPDRSLLYVQSQVPQHTELHYLLECTTGYGEAHRMIQFRERAARGDQVRLSLLTYPVLMAADILLHRAEEVPVGEDQTQHIELARAVAGRFNARYGPVFVLPRAVQPAVAARVMDLADPTVKMGKSARDDCGTIRLLDPPDVVSRKITRAVTDSARRVVYLPEERPGVANLLVILAACQDAPPTGLAELAQRFTGYGALKRAVTEAVDATLRPIRSRYAELSRDPGYVRQVLTDGAERARAATADTVYRARQAVGLLAR